MTGQVVSPKIYDFEDSDIADDNASRISDEDTEDASEGEKSKHGDFTEIKEQMYQDKLAQLKKQRDQLFDRTLPEYMKKLKRVEQHYRERLRLNDIWREYELDRVEREYFKHKKNVSLDFEDKKVELKENLLMELEEKKKNIELEYQTMELTGDTMEVKPVTTRKLRRRQTDPIPVPEKRRKASPLQINFFLDDEEIMADLQIINKVSGKPIQRKSSVCTVASTPLEPVLEAKIDDGRLYYDKRWFHRGQPVFAESKETGKFGAVICAISTQDIYVRKLTDNTRVRINLTQLQKGKFFLRRRST